jgi:hypothetical protein
VSIASVSVGDKATAAWANSVAAALNGPPIARLRNSTGISTTTGAYTQLTWDTEDFDTAGGHSTISNTSRYTVQTGYAGYYRVYGVVCFAAAAGSRRTASIYVNGAVINGGELSATPASSNIIGVAVEAIVFLNALDFVELYAFQNSGGAVLTNISPASQSSYLDIQWLRP